MPATIQLPELRSSCTVQLPAATVTALEQPGAVTLTGGIVVVPFVSVNENVCPAAPFAPDLQISMLPFAVERVAAAPAHQATTSAANRPVAQKTAAMPRPVLP
jgi:hypothetical protein